MARKPGRHPGRKSPVTGDAWADRFYYPMPTPDWSQDDSVITVDRMQAAWDALPEWAREYALKRQAGKTPICPDCEGKVITYPFNAVESYQGVRHTWCSYPEREAASA